MKHHEIVTQLAIDPAEIVYALTMETVLSAIVNRLGEKPVKLNKSRCVELDGANHLNQATEQEALNDWPD